MPVTNDGTGMGRGPLDDLLRLQTDFQERLAHETLRYLRQLQGLVGPVVPGTLVLPDPGAELSGAGPPGGTVGLALEIENRQRVHCLVAPMLSPLVAETGVTWFAETVTTPPSVLLATGATATVRLTLAVPADGPAGVYRGALLLHGFRGAPLPVRVTVTPAPTEVPA
jgi:hypothetical protein